MSVKNRRASGPVAPQGLGIGARFALVMSGVGAVLILLYALVVLSTASGALEQRIDQAGLLASRSMASGGDAAWVKKDKAGKKKAAAGSKERLKKLVTANPGQIQNAFILGNKKDGKKKVIVSHFKVGTFSPESTVKNGTTTIQIGQYQSGNFRDWAVACSSPL